MQLNAENMNFKPQTFDLIVGAAILHHLFEPEKVLAGCSKLLKPGGIAIFFEPFEEGYNSVKNIYKYILNDFRKYLLGPRKLLYLMRCVYIWQKMMHPDKTASFFNGRDDKWLFTKDFFTTLKSKYMFSDCNIYPLSNSLTPLEELIVSHFEGNNIHNMPKWVWDKIREFELKLSSHSQHEPLVEGCIIFKK